VSAEVTSAASTRVLASGVAGVRAAVNRERSRRHRAGIDRQAIARRVSTGKHVVLADLRQANADADADVMRNAGFEVGEAAPHGCALRGDDVVTPQSCIRRGQFQLQPQSRPRQHPASQIKTGLAAAAGPGLDVIPSPYHALDQLVVGYWPVGPLRELIDAAG
jgi:hypothetical protein